jgi:hypothetical protein
MTNAGYYSTGTALGPPTIPASTVALTNPYLTDCVVYIAGGTVTVIKVNGVTTGLTSGTFIVEATQSIAITYSVVPTSWAWMAL